MNRFQSEMGVIQRMNRPLQSVNREHSESEWNGPLYRHIQRLNGALSELNGKYSGRWMNRFLSEYGDIQGTSGTALRVKWKASQWPSEGFNSNVWESEWRVFRSWMGRFQSECRGIQRMNEWNAFRVNGGYSENEWTHSEVEWDAFKDWMDRFKSECKWIGLDSRYWIDHFDTLTEHLLGLGCLPYISSREVRKKDNLNWPALKYHLFFSF